MSRTVGTVLVMAVAMGSGSGIAAADTPRPTSAPAVISQTATPTFSFNKVNDSTGVLTLSGAKFVTDGTHTSIVDDYGKTLEVLPARIAQDGNITTFTYTLDGDHKATVRSATSHNHQVNEYVNWAKCTIGTAGGVITGGLIGAGIGGASGSAIPVAGTAAGAIGGAAIGATGGGATAAAANCFP